MISCLFGGPRISLRQEEGMDLRIKRREFFKAGGAALVASAGWPCFLQANESHNSEEENMEKRIIHIEVKVMSVKGTCGLGHKVGDTIKVTEQSIEGKICIHALYSMLPAVFAMMYEARFPWLTNPDKKTHACPDAANPVVFEIARIRPKIANRQFSSSEIA